MFATVLAIHGGTTKAIAPTSTLIRMAIARVGGIHGARSAILRGIYRTTLPITLRLCAIALDSHFWASLRLTPVVWTGCIAIRARLVTPRRRGRRVRFGRRGKRLRSSGRLICGLGFLGLHWRDA